jgi:DNA-directed RNA polymerase II subunit RPB2
MKEKTKIMFNGNWIGFAADPEKVISTIKKARDNDKISEEVSIVRDIVQNEIKIYTDSGRCMRPLFTVANNNLKLKPEDLEGEWTFDSLRKKGLIEYLDV